MKIVECIFYEAYCVILDNVTQKLKGLGESRHRLYYLLDVKLEDAINTLKSIVGSSMSYNISHANQYVRVENGKVKIIPMSEYSLWHHRLGHALLKKLNKIGCITHEKIHEECLICPMGKLTK